jgi:hypothetical protein
VYTLDESSERVVRSISIKAAEASPEITTKDQAKEEGEREVPLLKAMAKRRRSITKIPSPILPNWSPEIGVQVCAANTVRRNQLIQKKVHLSLHLKLSQ